MTAAHAAAAAASAQAAGGQAAGGSLVPAPSGVPKTKRLRQLLEYIAPQKALLALSFVLLLVHAGCRLAQPWLVMLAIDRYLVPGSDPSAVLWLATAFVSVALLEVVARWLQQVLLDIAGQRALLSLRANVFAHLQRLPTSFFDRTPIGRLVGRVTTDVEAVQELFASGVVTIFGDLVFLVAAVWIMLDLSAPLTGATMLVVPVLVLMTSFVRTRVRRAYASMRSALSQTNGFLHEQVSGMSVVQMFGQEERRRREFDGINGQVRDAQIDSVRWESLLSAGTEMLGSFVTALILWLGGSIALGAPPEAGLAGGALTLGALFAFVDYMQKFFGPLNDLSMKYTVMQNALVASDRIFAVLDEPAEAPDSEAARANEAARLSADDDQAGRGACAVEFRDVRFGYDQKEPVLKGLSFRVEPGESVALVGATGAGKSTILSLLSRLYDVDDGLITLDDAALASMPRAVLRRRVGLVPQESFLFHGTILQNIRLGHPEISDAEARAAADRLQLDEVAARFPRGYDEPLAERGKNLSAGERQLIAFARMLVLAPDVLLLDEATSNVDTHTEELLQGAVQRLMKGRTSLVVAHRLSTIRDADRILVLHQGTLVEEGAHEELLERKGAYWRLYQLQYAEAGSAN